MCSLNDVDGICENFIPVQQLSLSQKTCRSCESPGLVVLRKKDVYCRDCFLATEIHKFRAALGKSKMMKPQDNVLLAYSGSQSSAALLHLLHSGVNEDRHKKLLFNVFVLFIDEGILTNNTIEERQKIVESIKEKVDIYEFPLFITTLSEIFNELPNPRSCLKINSGNDSQLSELFKNTKSMTSKEDLLHVLRRELLLKAAQVLNCNKIFTAEVGTHLAVKLLTSFSLGRGDQVSFQTGFCDSRNPDLKVLRPLRDFTAKEIVFYNKFHGLEPDRVSSFTTKLPANISIQKLTEKFITDLQNGFPSTVYTIFRTGEKLSMNPEDSEEKSRVCCLCKNVIKTNSDKSNYTAVEAANFSKRVSRKKWNNCAFDVKTNCCGSCSNKNKTEITQAEMEKFLCYGCTLIIRDLKNIGCLPKDILSKVTEIRDFEAMKEQISEFLIEPSSELEV